MKKLFGFCISLVSALIGLFAPESRAQALLENAGQSEQSKEDLEKLKEAFSSFVKLKRTQPQVKFGSYLKDVEGYSDRELENLLKDRVKLEALNEFAKTARAYPFER